MTHRSKSEHLKLLADVSDELAELAVSTDVRGFLQKTAENLADHLAAAVCSIYLYDERKEELILEATVGLKPGSVGSVRLNIGEGLVGKSMRELRYIVVDEAGKHPDFLYFPEAGEDAFDCFLAAPILRGIVRIGVLVVQRESPRTFSEEEVSFVRALAAQLAGAVGHARALLSVQLQGSTAPAPVVATPLIQGEGASSGCALGRAFVFHRKSTLASVTASTPGGSSHAAVVKAFERTAAQLSEMQLRLKSRLPEAAALVFEAHIMMLQDEGFRGKIFAKMDEGLSDVSAVAEVSKQFMDIFNAGDHDYMREKAKDVEDLALRILDQLQAEEGTLEPTFSERIVIAKDLLPSDMLRLALEDVGGIILTGGGMTSHVAILARSLQIPTVIVRAPELLRVADGTLLGLNGDVGNIYMDPSDEVRAALTEHLTAEQAIEAEAAQMQAQTCTADGVRVRLMANINLLSELDLAEKLQAEGVGLYRTEFPFLVRDTFPTCEEQEVIYRHLFERMTGKEITVRTLDAGGDKMLSFFDTAGEDNPALGLRSTRFALRHPDVFDDQLTAILRSCDPGVPLRIMFPMISSPDEFIAARDRLLACVEAESDGEQILLQTGIMLELPAVIELMDEFVEMVDFFSVGTNDFVQYMVAADRGNAKVADYYCQHHPAVLRGLHRIISRAVAAGKDISICGEMAHDPRYVPFFVGEGVRKLSVDPRWLCLVQRTIQKLTVAEMERYAQDLLAAGTVEAVRSRLLDA